MRKPKCQFVIVNNYQLVFCYYCGKRLHIGEKCKCWEKVKRNEVQ